MFKKIFEKICTCIVILAILSILLDNCGYDVQFRGIMDAARTDAPKYKIILDSGVPLSDGTDENEMISICNQINAYRVANGEKELEWSPELAECAQIRANELSIKWSHVRPNGKMWNSVNEQIMGGENLSMGYNSKEVVSAWQASPEHNENLLYPDFEYIGLAECDGYIACEFSY